MKPKNAEQAKRILKDIEWNASTLSYMLENENINREIYMESSSATVKDIGKLVDQLKQLDQD